MLKARIAVLVSGGGTNLQALIDAQNSGIIHSGEISLVISNSQNAYALTRARNAGIKALYISKKESKTQEAFETAIIEALEENDIDLIVLAGFMSILSERFTSRYTSSIALSTSSAPMVTSILTLLSSRRSIVFSKMTNFLSNALFSLENP